MKLKRPGLRIIKTGVAVFICFMIGLIRGKSSVPFYSAIAAVICMKSSFESSLPIGINRMKGTVTGGIFGWIFLMIARKVNFLNEVTYHLVISLIIIFIIWFMVIIEHNNAVVIACIVFLSVTINHATDVDPFIFAINRMIDTLIGIVVSLLINRIDVNFLINKFIRKRSFNV